LGGASQDLFQYLTSALPEDASPQVTHGNPEAASQDAGSSQQKPEGKKSQKLRKIQISGYDDHAKIYCNQLNITLTL
jgi:hypothetical protein